MNTQIFNLTFKTLIINFLLLTSISTYAEIIDTSIVKKVAVNSDDLILVRSSNFDILIKTWKKNEVSIKYNLFVEAKSDNDSKNFVEAFNHFVDSRLNEKKGTVNIVDGFKLIDRSNKRVKVRFKSGSKTYVLKNFNGKIIIHMPKNNALNVLSVFRSLEIEDINADATISITNSYFKMGNCKHLNLTSSFSKRMLIGEVESADLNVNSSDLIMKAVKTDLTVKGSFSDIKIETIGNKANLDLNSSSFLTTDLKRLNVQGNFLRQFNVGNVEEAVINLKSSEFRSKKINSLTIENVSFSSLWINEVRAIQVKSSSSSKFYIETLHSLEAVSCSFSNFNIEELSKRFIVSSNSGNIYISKVLPTFDMIDINGKFVTTNIHVEKGSNYLVKADFQFPNYHFKNITYSNRIEMNHETIEGWSGNKEKAISEINLDCENCKIEIN